MACYAYFRLPRETHYTRMVQTQGEPLRLSSLAGLNGREGFVIAPFHISEECPLLLLQPDRVECGSWSETRGVIRGVWSEECEVRNGTRGVWSGLRGVWSEEGEVRNVESDSGEVKSPSTHSSLHLSPSTLHGSHSTLHESHSSLHTPHSTLHESHSTLHESHEYHIDFANFHAQICAQEFRKLVLARCSEEHTEEAVEPEELFRRACQLYPRMFIALVSTPASGTWLMATPEVLLEGGGSDWRTIALAGTMRLEGTQLRFDTPAAMREDIAWSTKNIQEQRYVATYIMECLEHFSADITEEGPATVRAGNLVHLRSDFNFTLPDNDRLGDLLQALHPTPAVCGLPKREALDFILRNEYAPRRYYSGFTGPLFPHGDTHLYVSLRCMQICGNRYSLYAGGGLLKDSVEQQEWEETEAKMETMRRCLTTEE